MYCLLVQQMVIVLRFHHEIWSCFQLCINSSFYIGKRFAKRFSRCNVASIESDTPHDIQWCSPWHGHLT